MEILINEQSDLPIYEQIIQQLRQQIISGQLPAGEELPSIRKLASGLGVSAITTKKAYEELSREGFVLSRPGKGMYVAQLDQAFIQEQSLAQLKLKFDEIIQQAQIESISKEMLTKLFNEALGGFNYD